MDTPNSSITADSATGPKPDVANANYPLSVQKMMDALPIAAAGPDRSVGTNPKAKTNAKG